MALRRKGIFVSRKRVERLMRENGLQASKVVRHHGGDLWYVAAPTDLLKRKFSVKALDRVWMGDFTDIPTDEGVLKLAAIEDACSRAIVGYAMSSICDTSLALRALSHAKRWRKPRAGLIYHVDRGSQFRSWRHEAAVENMGALSSYSAKGTPHDNACIESFFATLQKELFEDSHFTTKRQARSAVARFIRYYNFDRLHSTLGFNTPAEIQLAKAA
jgi:putative transposase